MPGRLQFTTPSALDYFRTLVADDASLSTIEAALSVAMVDYPGLDCQAVLAELDALADKLKRRMPADAAPMQKLRLLNRYFFDELGFAGNANDYYDPGNSYLHRVLRTRRGIPITLALLYIEFAGQIGLGAQGVSFPGHFLVKMPMSAAGQSGEVVIDPFDGRSLSREQLAELLAPYKRRQGLEGDFDIPLGLFLKAAPPREIIARLLRNLKEIHRTAADWPRALTVADRLVVLLPDVLEERRDRALVLAELGDFAGACADLEAFLRDGASEADRAGWEERLRQWRAARPPLH